MVVLLQNKRTTISTHQKYNMKQHENSSLHPNNEGKVTKKQLDKLRNRLKKISHQYRNELACKTGLHKNTIGFVLNDKIGVNNNTRLEVLRAANEYIAEYKHREQEVLAGIKNSTK
jgi:hypothetical protein